MLVSILQKIMLPKNVLRTTSKLPWLEILGEARQNKPVVAMSNVYAYDKCIYGKPAFLVPGFIPG